MTQGHDFEHEGAHGQDAMAFNALPVQYFLSDKHGSGHMRTLANCNSVCPGVGEMGQHLKEHEKNIRSGRLTGECIWCRECKNKQGVTSVYNAITAPRRAGNVNRVQGTKVPYRRLRSYIDRYIEPCRRVILPWWIDSGTFFRSGRVGSLWAD